jgi:hypothetical protein
MVSPSVRLGRPLLLVVVALAAGCSGGTGSISGRVTLKGAPLPAGLISFHSQVGNREVCNAIIRDGAYSLDSVPAGKAVVTVRAIQANPKGDTTRASSSMVSVPARYADPGKSGLSLTVQAGSQDFPVELTP